MCCSFVHFPMVLLGVYHVHRYCLCMTCAPHLFFLFFFFVQKKKCDHLWFRERIFHWLCVLECLRFGVVVSCMGCGGNIMCAWWRARGRASLIVLDMALCYDWICLWLGFWFGYGFGFVPLRFYCNGIVCLGIVVCLFYVLGEGGYFGCYLAIVFIW